MGNYYDLGTIYSSSNVDFSSNAYIWICSGTNAGDIIATTSVGLGEVTTGMMVVFSQATGGTIAAGLTSGSEYVVSAVTAATSSFQVYAQGGSSAVEVTADSTGTDIAHLIKTSCSVPVNDATYALVQCNPTSGYQGQFYFVGSNDTTLALDGDGRLTTGNPFVRLTYFDVTSSSRDVLSTANVISSGQSSTAFKAYRVDVAGFDKFAMRHTYSSSGALKATCKLYRD